MPRTTVLIYQEEGKTVPLVAWLTRLEEKARVRCLACLDLLAEQGHELRRPAAENIGGGLYELRVKFHHVNLRMLYFFHGKSAAVVSHGFAKEKRIPPSEIRMALKRMKKFQENPKLHTFDGEMR